MPQPRKWMLFGLVVFAISLGLMGYILHFVFGLQTNPAEMTGRTYPWNFMPLTAICLFVAAYVKDWRKALLIPLAIKVGIDLGILLFSGNLSFAFYSHQPVIYGSYLLFIGLGVMLRNKKTALRIGATGLLAESIFFIVSNFGSWLEFNTYPHTAAGLVTCYTMGLPFFGRSLISTFVYSGALFGGYAMLHNTESATEPQLASLKVE